MIFRKGEPLAENEPGDTEVDVGSSPAGPCASEVCVSPMRSQQVHFDGEVLAADPVEEVYSEEFLEHMRNSGVDRGSAVWEMLWREWQEEIERLERY